MANSAWMRSRDAPYLGVVVFMFAIAVAIAWVGDPREPARGAGLRDFAGQELVLILIGSENCGGSLRPELPHLVDSVRGMLYRKAGARGLKLTTHGVAVDHSVSQGMEFLNRFKAFDEISVGRSWLNEQAVKYLWREVPGPPIIPQIVIVTRAISVDEGTVSVSSEQLLARIIGAPEIKRFVMQGAPLPLTHWPRNPVNENTGQSSQPARP